jgi:uncharacterized protein YecT (DUF1311 family)
MRGLSRLAATLTPALAISIILPLPASGALAQMPSTPADAPLENILKLEDGQRLDCTDGGDTTVDRNACASARLELLDKEMARYWQAARTRFAKETIETQYNRDSDAQKAEALANFDAAQDHWAKYRSANCGSVYYEWRGGTIRGQMYLGCQIEMVKKRTWEIWSTWLTYPDSTPALLPEPAL